MDNDPADLWDKMEAYLRGCIENLPQKPKAILIISGHWEEETVTIQSNLNPPMLFDYGGFPPHTYELKFPATGSPELVSRVAELLQQNGIDLQTDAQRGFDHGTFIPLLVALPKADIPVVQLSMRADMNPEAHIKLGEALQPLRDEGILIIGSGMSYHNLRSMFAQMGKTLAADFVIPQALEFHNWLTDAVTHAQPQERNNLLADWASAPMARQAHPREEHLLPLHVVAGAAGGDIGTQALNDVVLGTPQSAFIFGG